MSTKLDSIQIRDQHKNIDTEDSMKPKLEKTLRTDQETPCVQVHNPEPLHVAPTSQSFILKLLKTARGGGNDQYEGEEKTKLYLPKTVTHGEPLLTVTLSSEPTENAALFTMKKAAKGSGGDRYETSCPSWKGQDIYLPNTYRAERYYVLIRNMVKT